VRAGRVARRLPARRAGRTGLPSWAGCGLALALLVAAPVAALPGDDGDGDGVLDGLDNCLEAHNPAQQDSDGDGYGNACDFDYDQDGIVNFADLARLRRSFFGTSPLQDHDGNGVVNFGDLALFARGFLRPPGPVLDADGDGTPDGRDGCPLGRLPGADVVPGCSAMDLARSPGLVVRALLSSIAEAQAILADQLAAAAAAGFIETARGEVDEAGEALRDGALCRAPIPLERAVGALASAGQALADPLRDLERLLRTQAGDEDVPELESRHAAFRGARDLLDRAGGRVAGLGEALSVFCDGAVRLAGVRGVVSRLSDGDGVLELEDGTVLLRSGGTALQDDVWEGAPILFTGLEAVDGGVIAESIALAPGVPDIQDLPPLECLRLRVVPVQPLGILSPGASYEHHDPRGYQLGDVLRLEQGMGLAVEQVCPSGDETGLFVRYSMRIRLVYVDVATETFSEAFLAVDLREGQPPVLLPGDVDPDQNALLETRVRKQDCIGAPPARPTCDLPVTVVERSRTVRVRERGHFCTARYDQQVFDVDDQVPGDFRVATALSPVVLAAFDAGTTPVFEAEGWAATAGPPAQTTFPTVSNLAGEASFTIRNTDFFPIYRSQGLQALYAQLLSGVDRAAGLRWPRLRGQNQGLPFRYACRLPTLVRDVVDFCPGVGTPDAFYRMPFPAGDESWSQGQGNLPSDPDATHFGGFALDMLAPLGEEILFARGGEVVSLDESQTLQVGDPGCPDWCPANVVWVRHQDGSFGQYVHMPQNGIEPALGDVVRRGERLGVVGVTGNTSGPHLHYAAKVALADGGTLLALFQAVEPDDESQTLTCYEPMKGDLLRSNNEKQ